MTYKEKAVIEEEVKEEEETRTQTTGREKKVGIKYAFL